MNTINIKESIEKNDYIKKRLNDEKFYHVLNNFAKNKFFPSVESAMLNNAITNGFATYLHVNEKLKEKNINKKDKNIMSSLITAVIGKQNIKNYFSIKNNINLKLDTDYEKEKDEIFEDILRTYTTFVSDEILNSKNKNTIKDFDDLVDFSYEYFDTLEKDAKKNKLEEELTIKYKNLIFSGLNYGIKEDKDKITFDDIGGLKEAKEYLYYISKGLSNPKMFEEEGLKPPKGVIIWGPPGVGKTLVAKALAYESGLPFKDILISNIVNKWYGEPSKKIAEEMKFKGIVMFDELDTLARARGSYTNEGTSMVVNTINQVMNEENPGTFYIGTTNKLEDIDPAIKRAGRFDKIIECKRPDKKSIVDIFKIHKNYSEKLANKKLFKDIDYDIIAGSMERKKMVGSDINEIIKRTLEVERYFRKIDGKKQKMVTTNSILNEINRYERTKETYQEKNMVVVKNE